MVSSFTLPAVIIAAVGIIFMIWFKGLRPFRTGDKGRDLTDRLSRLALVKFKPTTRFEGVLQRFVSSFVQKGRYVLLVSSAPRADFYGEAFEEELKDDKMRLIKVTASPRTERFYINPKEAKKDGEKGKIAEISVDWMEYLSEVVETLPKDSVMVFEPLSDLILMNGFEKAYKFIKKTLDYCVEAGVQMISFINDDAHEESVKASFEGLFTNILIAVDNRVEIVK